MAAAKKVKWALGSDEPDDLGDFKDNEQIVKENGKKLPGKGPFTFAVKRLAVKPNKNGDDRISVMLVMKEPKKSKAASYNGYLVWDGFNVTEQGAPFIKRFLKALGLEWKDFIDRSKQDDQDPPHIVQIGKVKFETGDDPTVRVLCKIMPADDFNDAEHLEVQRYLPLDDEEPDDDEEEDDDDAESFDDDEDSDEDEDDSDDDEDDEDDEDDSDEDDDEDEDEDDDDEEDDDEDEEADTADSLKSWSIADLRARAKENGRKKKAIEAAGKKKSALIAMIVEDEELPPF
jgi:hypothetical protein